MYTFKTNNDTTFKLNIIYYDYEPRLELGMIQGLSQVSLCRTSLKTVTQLLHNSLDHRTRYSSL